ncbi:MAG: hypothetical protein Q7S68_01345, partial [Deltaproteobacteria bacterium]|nr:hypothetical protein [Deltaproteobacteria bacterium]
MVLPTSVAISKVVDRNVYRSLVHEPHCSLLRIYLDALRQHDAGTLAQREAIRSALRLELLSKDQYTHADRFLGNLQKIGFDPGGTDHARSRHLLNFLAPGNREQREQILFGWRKKNPAHPVKRPRRQRVEIGKMNRLSISPAMNVALLPIGI